MGALPASGGGFRRILVQVLGCDEPSDHDVVFGRVVNGKNADVARPNVRFKTTSEALVARASSLSSLMLRVIVSTGSDSME